MDSDELHHLLQTDIRTELAPDVVASIISKPPFVSIPGVFNVRDVSTANSHFNFPTILRPGIVYRSGVPPTDLPAEAQTALVQNLGITTIFDLRRPHEREIAPSPSIDGVENVWLPYALETPRPSYAEFAGSDGGIATFTRLYRSYLDTHVPIYRKVFEHIRDRPQAPFLFHCSAGKDRTGVLAALILRIAGSSDPAIIHDYMLTRAGIEPARPRLTAMLKGHHGLDDDDADLERTGMITLFGVQLQGMIGFLRALDEMGGAEVYLRQRLGLSEQDVMIIRENLRVELS